MKILIPFFLLLSTSAQAQADFVDKLISGAKGGGSGSDPLEDSKTVAASQAPGGGDNGGGGPSDSKLTAAPGTSSKAPSGGDNGGGGGSDTPIRR